VYASTNATNLAGAWIPSHNAAASRRDRVRVWNRRKGRFDEHRGVLKVNGHLLLRYPVITQQNLLYWNCRDDVNDPASRPNTLGPEMSPIRFGLGDVRT